VHQRGGKLNALLLPCESSSTRALTLSDAEQVARGLAPSAVPTPKQDPTSLNMHSPINYEQLPDNQLRTITQQRQSANHV